MLSTQEKAYKEMTVEERLQKIHKMSSKDLYNIINNNEDMLTSKELEAIYSELDKRGNRRDKATKTFHIATVASALFMGAVGLICNSSDKS